MSDTEDDPRLPRTPVAKRPRRVSDVIDSMGDSPSPSTSYFSTSPAAAGYLTPQRPSASNWNPAVRFILVFEILFNFYEYITSIDLICRLRQI